MLSCYNYNCGQGVLEKEVAIDPELLGKAYEKFNAIRPDNFDEFKKALKSGRKGEEYKFNKKFGVYYTPWVIVHYMCQQSLINYLAVDLKGKVNKEVVEFLILEGEKYIEHLKTAKEKKERNKNYKGDYQEKEYFIELKKYAGEIDNSLLNIKVCDPAAGSGAFPVGMMSEIIKARMFFVETGCLENIYLNSHQKRDYKKQFDKLISEITNRHAEFDFEVYFSEVFHEKGGFDVVIADPPYVRADSGLILYLLLASEYTQCLSEQINPISPTCFDRLHMNALKCPNLSIIATLCIIQI